MVQDTFFITGFASQGRLGDDEEAHKIRRLLMDEIKQSIRTSHDELEELKGFMKKLKTLI